MDGFRLQRAAIVAVLVALAAWAPAAQAADFVGPTDYAVGSNELAIAAGDFNGDSDADLATLEYSLGAGNGPVNVLLGGSGGTFAAAPGSPFTGGGYATAVGVGNFDAGSDPDLAVPDWFGGNVAVLLGGTGGTFAAAPGSPFAAGTNPVSVAVGDFNADSDPDLAVANYGSGAVSILLGGAGGSFSPEPGSPYSVGVTPYAIEVGNFNGGSDLDLAVAGVGGVDVLLGGTGGSFTNEPASPYAVGSSWSTSQTITSADFNADSDPDLAVSDYGDKISILLGATGGSFSAAADVPLAAGSYPNSVVTGKFDSNSDPDLAVANGGGNVAILLGGAGGSFGAPAYFGPIVNPIGLVVRDFDADADDDVATANYGDGNVSVLLQVDTLGFARPKSATPSTIRLVPAFNQCSGASPAGMTHGPPLAVPSCSPPAQSSSYLTLNAPDRPAPFNTAAAGVASLYMKVFCDNSQAPPCPASGDQIDIELTSGVTDVRCVAAGPNCSAAGALYVGKLLFNIPLRITDKLNGSGQTAGATVMDTPLQFGAQCGLGSCSVATSVDSVIPGFAKEGKRAVLGLGRIEVRDGGPDGDLVDAPLPAVGTCPPVCAGNGGETVFLHQGFLVP